MARRPAEDVTETELAILQVLWDRGETTRRQIADVLYPGGSEVHYATVQNLLGRLDRKGYVRSTREGNVLIFSAIVDRDELIRRRLQGLADKLYGGAARTARDEPDPVATALAARCRRFVFVPSEAAGSG